MFSMPPSLTHDLPLDALLHRLRRRREVVGLVMVGSLGHAALKPESDYDLLIVLDKLPLPLDVALTTIDGRVSDVLFCSLAQVEALLTVQTLTARMPERALLHWLHSGRIDYDRTGRLAQVRDHAPNVATAPDRAAQFRLWYAVNFNLLHGERLLRSGDEVYLLAMDFRFLYMLQEVLEAYLLNHGIPQRGEKHTIRHLQRHAPNHLWLYTAALHATDRRTKFLRYTQFAEIALAPVGGLWPGPDLTAFNLPLEMPLNQHNTAFAFWRDLLDAE